MEGEELQERLADFVRTFGLHRVDRTPCGQPLSVSEAHAVSDIGGYQPLSAGELAKRLRLEKSTVSRIIAQLQRRGWVERTPHAEDRRVGLLTLTPAGRRAEAALAEARGQHFSSLLNRIPVAERPGVLRALDVVVAAMNAQMEEDPASAESGEDRR